MFLPEAEKECEVLTSESSGENAFDDSELIPFFRGLLSDDELNLITVLYQHTWSKRLFTHASGDD